MALADDCVFCNILKGNIPSTKIYEDDLVLAFLDIAPFKKGHTLIIPKDHQHSCTTLAPEYLSAMINLAPKIGTALMRVTGAEGFNILMNNGRVAGQMVPHVHLHVIPRFADDKIVFFSNGEKYNGAQEMTALADEVIAKLSPNCSELGDGDYSA